MLIIIYYFFGALLEFKWNRNKFNFETIDEIYQGTLNKGILLNCII